MKTAFNLKVILIVVCSIFFLAVSNPAEADAKFNIGYLEGGEYWLFAKTFQATKAVLEKKGWKEKINFNENYYFSPGWDKKEKAWDKKAQFLMNSNDLDLIIGMGTDATRALLKANNNKTAILGMGVSDALKSKFIKDENDSGIDNFTVRIVKGRFYRMFEIFHQVIGFQKLGLIYPDSESGKKYTNLEDAYKVAQKQGFEIIEYKLKKEDSKECLNGLKSLVKKGMEAFFIPSLLCFDWEKSDVEKLFIFLQEKSIPTFARNGSKDVKAGALMGFSTVDFTKRGEFLADKIIKILKGSKPRDLIMKDQAIPKISLNIAVAEKIGFDLPFDILAATDEIYQDISLPEKRVKK